MYKEFRAINATSSRKNVWNMKVGIIFFFSLRALSLMIGLLLISRMINQFKLISSSRLSRWTKKTGITS